MFLGQRVGLFLVNVVPSSSIFALQVSIAFSSQEFAIFAYLRVMYRQPSHACLPLY